MTEKELLESGYKKYSGTDIDVYYNKDICQHLGECVHGDGDIFEVGRIPWIKIIPGRKSELISIINKCSSGALKYKLKDSNEILP